MEFYGHFSRFPTNYFLMKFSSLNDFYEHLEKTITSIDVDHRMPEVKLFAEENTDPVVKEKIEWECYALDFNLKEGTITPICSTTGEDGKYIYQYPSFENLGDKGLGYVQARAQATKNDYLIVRYNQILWNSYKPFKNQMQAKISVDAYFRILSKIDFSALGKEFHAALNIIKNAFNLSLQAKHRDAELKLFLHSLLFDKKKLPNQKKVFLVKYLLNVAQFTKSDFDGYLDLMNAISKGTRSKGADFFAVQEIYKTGLALAQRIGGDTKIWHKRLGDANVKVAEYRMDDETRLVPLKFLRDAIPYYKLAGLSNKVKETEERYSKLKGELKLQSYESSLDDAKADDLRTHLKAKTAAILKLSSEEIYGFLLAGADIFPEKQWVATMGKTGESSFMDFAVNMSFDINNNLSENKGTKAERDKRKLFQNYQIYLTLYALPLLRHIFIEGIKSGKVNYPSLYAFFLKETWLGQKLRNADKADDVIDYSWISLIAPSIWEYFKQTEAALKSKEYKPNYIMPIDSLTLKFEGVLRDFARLLGLSTTTSGRGSILREKYIEEVLAEKKVKEFFDENDLLLFSYLFTAKEGMNLRNNIAHCFYKYRNYNFEIMHLLICAFLRIGKYRIRLPKK